MPDEELVDEQQGEAEAEEQEQEGEEGKPSLQDQLKEIVEVNVEDAGPLRKKLTVTIPQDKIGEQLDEQYTELRKDAAVPGFRKGRAPRRLLEKRFGSEIGETLLQQLVTSGYLAAVDKINLKVLGDPLIWIKEKGAETETLVDVQKAVETMTLPAGEPLQFSCEVEIRPEFELPETEGIPLEKPVILVSDEDVSVQIDRIRRNRGSYETQPEGTVQADDVVMADVKMSSGETTIKEQADMRLAARPQQLDGVILEKMGEVLTGAKPGEVRKVSGTIPDDYAKAEFRGKQADFEIKVREVQRLRMPEMNADFVKSLGFSNEEELRKWVREDLESRLGEQLKRGLQGQVFKYLLDNAKFDLPARMSERQAGRVLLRRMLDLYRQGVPQAEVEKHLDELRTGAQEETARELKLFFIMEKLAEKIEVEVGEGELNSQIAAIAQRQGRRFDRVRDELAKEGGLMSLYLQIRDEKLVDQLVSKAKITETQPAAKPEAGKKKRAGKEPAAEAAPAEPAAEASGEGGEAGAPKKRSRVKRMPPKKGNDADAT